MVPVHLNTRNISHSKIFCIENYSKSLCNDVDTCFLLIPHGIVEVLKTMDYLQGSISYAATNVDRYTHEHNMEKLHVIKFLELKNFLCLLSLQN